MVTEDKSKAVAPSKSVKPFRKSDLPKGLNYEVFHCTIIPTVIAYYVCQKDPWDQPQSVLCNEIHIIMKSASGVDFEVDPKGLIYKNIHTIRYGHHSCY